MPSRYSAYQHKPERLVKFLPNEASTAEKKKILEKMCTKAHASQIPIVIDVCNACVLKARAIVMFRTLPSTETSYK